MTQTTCSALAWEASGVFLSQRGIRRIATSSVSCQVSGLVESWSFSLSEKFRAETFLGLGWLISSREAGFSSWVRLTARLTRLLLHPVLALISTWVSLPYRLIRFSTR